MSDSKRCIVAWIAPGRELLLEVELPAQATVADAIEAARQRAGDESIPWDTAVVGIFGEIRTRSAQPRDRDRIELYRPLRTDPKEARRSRARRPACG